MNNIEIANNPGIFFAAYEKTKEKSDKAAKKPFNTAKDNLTKQLKKFKDASFTDDDARALHKDLLSI